MQLRYRRAPVAQESRALIRQAHVEMGEEDHAFYMECMDYDMDYGRGDLDGWDDWGMDTEPYESDCCGGCAECECDRTMAEFSTDSFKAYN